MASRGRPKFVPTVAQRRSVEQMTAVGESRDVIARALGISDDTLAKYFANELSHGRAKRRREVIDLLFKSARGGNVSAQKKLDDMTGALPPPPPNPGPDSEKAAPKRGKKEEADLAAETAAEGTEWGHLVH